MILIDIEIYDTQRKDFVAFEAIVDTGATYCVIEKSIAEELNLKPDEILHLWQMGEALNIPKTKVRLRYEKKEYLIDALIVEIKESYKRVILPKEKCTRPESPHPLSNRIVIGKSLLDRLPSNEYRKLFT